MLKPERVGAGSNDFFSEEWTMILSWCYFCLPIQGYNMTDMVKQECYTMYGETLGLDMF